MKWRTEHVHRLDDIDALHDVRAAWVLVMDWLNKRQFDHTEHASGAFILSTIALGKTATGKEILKADAALQRTIRAWGGNGVTEAEEMQIRLNRFVLRTALAHFDEILRPGLNESLDATDAQTRADVEWCLSGDPTETGEFAAAQIACVDYLDDIGIEPDAHRRLQILGGLVAGGHVTGDDLDAVLALVREASEHYREQPDRARDVGARAALTAVERRLQPR